jgi:hypothetical protein
MALSICLEAKRDSNTSIEFAHVIVVTIFPLGQTRSTIPFLDNAEVVVVW